MSKQRNISPSTSPKTLSGPQSDPICISSDEESETNASAVPVKPNVSSLQDKEWLKDVVIDAYFKLMVLRSNTDQSLPRIHCFSTTFFQIWERHHSWEKLCKSVKEVDFFKFDLLMFPVNIPLKHPNHWVLVVSHPKLKLVEYFDSLRGRDNDCLKTKVLSFFAYQVEQRTGEKLDKDVWCHINRLDQPNQTNGHDCGVFICQYAERLARKSTFDFTQEDMPAIRQQMKSQILRGSIQGENAATRWGVPPEVEIKRLREELQKVNAKCEEAERIQRSFAEQAYQMEARNNRQIQFVVQPAQLAPTEPETIGTIPALKCETLIPTVVLKSTVTQVTIRVPVFKAVAVRQPEPSTRPKPAPRIETAGRCVQTSPVHVPRPPPPPEPSTRPKTPPPIESVACGVQTSPQTAQRYFADSDVDSPPNAANASRADRRAAMRQGFARRCLTFDDDATKRKRRRNNSTSSEDDAPKRKQPRHSSARSPMKNINTTLPDAEEVAPASPLPLVIDERYVDIEYPPLDPHWLPYVREIEEDDDGNHENQSPPPTQLLPIDGDEEDHLPILPAAQPRPMPLQYDSHTELIPPTLPNGCAPLIRRHPVLGLRIEPLPPQAPDTPNFRQFAWDHNIDLEGVNLADLWEDLEYRRQYLMRGQHNEQHEELILALVPPAYRPDNLHFRALIALAFYSYDHHIALALIYSYTRMQKATIANLLSKFE